MRDRMLEVGIDAPTQEALINKMQSGVLPDSTGGAEPVDTFTINANGVNRTVEVFADGSRRWTDLENPSSALDSRGNASINARGIQSCGTSGLWRTNCKVYSSDLVSEVSFRIDWKPVSVTPAAVRNYWGKSCSNYVGGCSVDGGIRREAQSSSGPAVAYASFTANLSVYHVSGELALHVSGSSASVILA